MRMPWVLALAVALACAGPDRRQSIRQSPFWTTGPSTDGLALYERLTALDPYPFGETRAVLIEDLDGLALELIEAGS